MLTLCGKVSIYATLIIDLPAVTWLPHLGHLIYSLQLYFLSLWILGCCLCRLCNLNCLFEFEVGPCLESLLGGFVLELAHNMRMTNQPS